MLYFDKEGKEIPRYIWADLITNEAYCFVMQDRSIDLCIKTEWTGADIPTTSGDSRWIFKTTVKRNNRVIDTKWASSYKEALETHVFMTNFWGLYSNNPEPITRKTRWENLIW